jgi:hypothetical protein
MFGRRGRDSTELVEVSPLELRHEGGAMRPTTVLFLFILTLPAVLLAAPVTSIQFQNGNVLNIQGIVGSGPNTAYLAIDFSNNAPPGPAFAWEYQWTGSETESQMLTAVAAADTALTVVPDPTYGLAFIDNFDYGTNIGSAQPFLSAGYSYWASYLGQYASATKSISWVFAPFGSTSLTLGNLYDSSGDLTGSGEEGLLYGWTINGESQTTNLDPNLPQTTGGTPLVALPSPAWSGLSGLLGLAFLAYCKKLRKIPA